MTLREQIARAGARDAFREEAKRSLNKAMYELGAGNYDASISHLDDAHEWTSAARDYDEGLR
jgi:hypothetical protein